MIYNKIFKQKERGELIDLLSERKRLSYDAKSALLEVIHTDEFFNSQYTNELNKLKEDVDGEESSISSFSYLKYLGFRIIQEGDTIRITRLSRFYFVDLLGILIGALLAGVAYFGLSEWRIILTEGVSTMPAVISLSTAIVSIVGIILLARSLSRYLEYSGFEIVKNSTGLLIRKRNDIMVDSILVKNSSLDLEETENALFLVYHNEKGESVRVIKTSGGMKVRKTLIHLKNLLAGA